LAFGVVENLNPASCSILSLDLSDNQLGDRGAFLLAQFLKKNPKLQYLYCDNNAFTFTGYKSIHRVIKNHNTNLIHYAHAWKDYYTALSNYVKDPALEKRMRNIIIGIQDKVAMNRMNKTMQLGEHLKTVDLNVSRSLGINSSLSHSSGSLTVPKPTVESPTTSNENFNINYNIPQTTPQPTFTESNAPVEQQHQFFGSVDVNQLEDEEDDEGLLGGETLNLNPFASNTVSNDHLDN